MALSRVKRKQYDQLFSVDPLLANTFLLLCEMADKHGQVKTDEEEIQKLLVARFDDPWGYAL